MVNKKSKVLNFDTDVFDGKSALKAYRTILGEWIEIIHKGDRVSLDDILQDLNYPEWGFKKDILPHNIRNVLIKGERMGQVVLGYVGKLDHELEKKYWEEKGYSIRKSRFSMEIVDEGHKAIATYNSNNIFIERDRLDQFIEEMR